MQFADTEAILAYLPALIIWKDDNYMAGQNVLVRTEVKANTYFCRNVRCYFPGYSQCFLPSRSFSRSNQLDRYCANTQQVMTQDFIRLVSFLLPFVM